MAQPIQVPQTVPNAPQFQVPTDLVNAYLARKQQGQQFDTNLISSGFSDLNTYKQQKIQNQLAALGAYASIAKAVGPDSANQVAGQIPNMPSWSQPSSATPAQGNAPYMNPSVTPSNPGAGMQTPAPSNQPPQQQSLVSQDQAASPYIQASVDSGHPDITGHAQKFSPSGQIPPGGTVPLTNLSDQIAALNAQMGQYRNKGDWGMEQQKQISDQIAGLKAQQDAANSPEQFVASKNMDVNKGSAAEADKFAEGNVKTGSGMDAFRQLQNLWDQVPASQKGPAVGILSSKAGDIASGKFPEAVAYNKAREGLIGAIVAGIDPQGRQGPSLLAQMEKAVPTLQTDEKSRKILMSSLYDQLKSQATRNYEGHNTAAQQFGGSIPRPNFPPQSQSNGPQIGQAYKGHVFLGGDPSNPKSWRKQ